MKSRNFQFTLPPNSAKRLKKIIDKFGPTNAAFLKQLAKIAIQLDDRGITLHLVSAKLNDIIECIIKQEKKENDNDNDNS